MTTAAAIRALAEKRGVVYTQTATDVWAHHVTRLSDDEARPDEIELLLMALHRAGHLTRPEALQLQCDYLRELKVLKRAKNGKTPFMSVLMGVGYDAYAGFGRKAYRRSNPSQRKHSAPASQTSNRGLTLGVSDKGAMQCLHCRYYVELTGEPGTDWGACTGEESQHDGQLVFEHWTCRNWAEEEEAEQGSL